MTADTEVSLDLVGLMQAFEAGSELMGDDAILAFTRVLGASAMNIAEAAVALFWAEFGPGSVSEGPDELARAKLSEAATRAFLAVPDVMAQAVMDQFERAQRRAQSVRGWAASLDRRQRHRGFRRPHRDGRRSASSTLSARPHGLRPSACASRALR